MDPEDRTSRAFDPVGSQLDDYTVDEWCAWLSSFLESPIGSPGITLVDEELQHAALRVYRNLSPHDARDRFSEAVSSLFETTLVMQNAERLYYLLELIKHITPLAAKLTVRRRLFKEALLTPPLFYGPFHLHTVLLSAVAKYATDDQLRDYIIHSSRQEWATIDYLALALRVLADRSSRDCFYFLEIVICKVTTDQEFRQVASSLKGSLMVLSYRSFFDWLRTVEPTLAKTHPLPVRRFKDAVRAFVAPWAATRTPTDDEFKIVVAALLSVGKHRFLAAELEFLVDLWPGVGRDKTIYLLTKIYQARVPGQPNEPAWKIIDERARPTMYREKHYAVFTGTHVIRLDPETKSREIVIVDSAEACSSTDPNEPDNIGSGDHLPDSEAG